MTDQLPPADELAEIRDTMKALEDRRSALRSLVLADPSARTGNHHVVEIRKYTTKRPDLVEMRKCHPGLFEEFTFPREIEQIEILDLTEDGEIVRHRKQP